MPPARWRWVHGGGFKLRLSVEAGKRQRRRATLLKDPELIYRGAKAMREAVPEHLPVTVKVRLGWDSGERRFEIADAVQQAGASELVVHGRTKEDGYKAERINWQAIGEIRQRLTIPVVANGEIWDWQSAQIVWLSPAAIR